jgi:hypothetical protein
MKHTLTFLFTLVCSAAAKGNELNYASDIGDNVVNSISINGNWCYEPMSMTFRPIT